MAMVNLVNKSEHVFTDISSEVWRVYIWSDGSKVKIIGPQWLSVAKSGGARILDEAGICHYIPFGWRHLLWEVKDGEHHFVK